MWFPQTETLLEKVRQANLHGRWPTSVRSGLPPYFVWVPWALKSTHSRHSHLENSVTPRDVSWRPNETKDLSQSNITVISAVSEGLINDGHAGSVEPSSRPVTALQMWEDCFYLFISTILILMPHATFLYDPQMVWEFALDVIIGSKDRWQEMQELGLERWLGG